MAYYLRSAFNSFIITVIGIEFERKADSYLKTMLCKGVPSLFANLKPVMKDAEKSRILYALLQSYLKSYENDKKFFKDGNFDENPSVYVWIKFFLAQYHDRTSDFEVALTFINEAIEHTPTLLELYMIKAKILKVCTFTLDNW